jgi:hypothetical protein
LKISLFKYNFENDTMDLKDSLNLEYAGQRFTWDESGLYCIFVGSK